MTPFVIGDVRHPLCSRIWMWPNLLSLDAPLVAVLWQALFIRCFHGTSAALPLTILFSSVWLIYSMDRALDVWRGTGSRPRHEFYRRHWRAVLPVWSGVVAITVWLTLDFLPRLFFDRGVLLGTAVIVYLAVVHLLPKRLRGIWPKEGAVAVVFGLGISLVIWSGVRTAADVLTIFLFACLCWINCIAIEHWEGEGRTNAHGIQRHIGATAICIALAAILLLHRQRPILGIAETASAIAFVLLDRFRQRLSPDALRVLADAALLSPIFFLAFPGIHL